MTRRLTLFAALALIGFAGGFFFMQQDDTAADPFGAAFAQNADDVDTSMIKEMSLGNPDAKVTVIEYASFTCPHCAAFHADSFKKLKADFIDPGLIHFVNREIYFDRPGLWAGITARCGDNAESRYFGIIDMIYDQQSQWARQENGADIVASLRKIGKTAGLTDGDLDQCFSDGARAEALWATFLKNSEADGIRSTPSFVINGELYSNMPYSEMKALIEDALNS